MLLPDVRLHNKKYSRFYSITDERKRKVLNVKKRSFFLQKNTRSTIEYSRDTKVTWKAAKYRKRLHDSACGGNRQSDSLIAPTWRGNAEQVERAEFGGCDCGCTIDLNSFPCFCRVRLLMAHPSYPRFSAIFAPFPEIKSAKFGFFCIFIGFHLQIPLLSRIMKRDYIGVVGRAA